MVLARSLRIGLTHTCGWGVTQTYGRGVSHTDFGAVGEGVGEKTQIYLFFRLLSRNFAPKSVDYGKFSGDSGSSQCGEIDLV